MVGTNRSLRARLVDASGNGISGQILTFTRTAGSGTFSGLISTTGTTGTDGSAEVIYTIGTNIALSPETINVTFPGVTTQTYSIPLQTAAVSYYDFTPAGPRSTTAGVGLSYTVTARDIYGNAVINNDNMVLTASGIGYGSIHTQYLPISFANGSTVNVTVTDIQVGDFHGSRCDRDQSWSNGSEWNDYRHCGNAHFLNCSGCNNPNRNSQSKSDSYQCCCRMFTVIQFLDRILPFKELRVRVYSPMELGTTAQTTGTNWNCLSNLPDFRKRCFRTRIGPGLL